MTATQTGPAGRMQIARGLISLRERCGLTQTQVANRAGVSTTTVSRYEAWQDRARIRWATVKALADACEATPQEREALVAIAKSQADGWWVGNSAVPEWLDPLVSFEHAAAYEHVSRTPPFPACSRQGSTPAPSIRRVKCAARTRRSSGWWKRG